MLRAVLPKKGSSKTVRIAYLAIQAAKLVPEHRRPIVSLAIQTRILLHRITLVFLAAILMDTSKMVRVALLVIQVVKLAVVHRLQIVSLVSSEPTTGLHRTIHVFLATMLTGTPKEEKVALLAIRVASHVLVPKAQTVTNAMVISSCCSLIAHVSLLAGMVITRLLINAGPAKQAAKLVVIISQQTASLVRLATTSLAQIAHVFRIVT